MCLTIIFARPSKTRNLPKFPRFRRIPFSDIIGDPIGSPVMSTSYPASGDGDGNPLLRSQPKHQTWTAHHRPEIMTTQRQLRDTSVTPMTSQRSVSTSQENTCSDAANQTSLALWSGRIHQSCELLDRNESNSIWRGSTFFRAFDLWSQAAVVWWEIISKDHSWKGINEKDSPSKKQFNTVETILSHRLSHLLQWRWRSMTILNSHAVSKLGDKHREVTCMNKKPQKLWIDIRAHGKIAVPNFSS